jgi:hypothetical protein
VVAIRDGKTSSETVRQSALNTAVETVHKKSEETFEEFVLLDSVGRLQVPREYLEQFNIQGRVHLEAVENGILIRPVTGTEAESQSPNHIDENAPEISQTERLGLRGGKDSVQ